MRFRKLRLLWTVFCGIACGLLIVLWIRSYWHMVFVSHHSDNSYVRLYCSQGMGCFLWNKPGPPLRPAEKHWVLLCYLPPTAEPGNEVRSQWSWSSVEISVYLPLWLLLLCPAALAALPWIRWHFTLRTLLIATTLVAVVLGLIVYAVR